MKTNPIKPANGTLPKLTCYHEMPLDAFAGKPYFSPDAFESGFHAGKAGGELMTLNSHEGVDKTIPTPDLLRLTGAILAPIAGQTWKMRELAKSLTGVEFDFPMVGGAFGVSSSRPEAVSGFFLGLGTTQMPR